jgi:hypothetical protein
MPIYLQGGKVTTEQRLDSIDSRLVALLTVAEAQQEDITALTENIAAVNHSEFMSCYLPLRF